ncbi:flippase activity-associated protein Agl23 [Haloplanus sp. GCM10025708]|uniref:flippase activity-associated protein Agl23 n=1 Tax=Haloplanus sp. GCM10025708 TaxID=3252679 RepID=UPI003610ECD6
MRSEEGTGRTLFAVLAVTAVALAVRLIGLGTRIFHWDEGRVGYWILRYHESGQFSYRPIVHGPFLFVTNDYVFSVLPPSDFSARLVVALVGGLLPLSAWLLRDRLRDAEVVALAAVLAANPLLVYYSRFMRNDVLVGAFAFVALALFVRAVDAGKTWPVFLRGVARARLHRQGERPHLRPLLSGGGVSPPRPPAVSRRQVRPVRPDRPVRRLAARARLPPPALGWERRRRPRRHRRRGNRGRRRLLRGHRLLLRAAPGPLDGAREPGAPPGRRRDGHPRDVGAVLGPLGRGAHQSHDYLPFLYDYLETLVYGAPVVLAFAAVGVAVDGYLDDAYREIVAFAAYWGAVSVLGYPVATDIRAPWAVVHAVVPLAIPAAVGVAHLYRVGRPTLAGDGSIRARADSLATPESRRAVVAAVLLLSAAVGVAGANAAYMNSASDDTEQVLQWAQPENDLKETLDRVRVVARANEDEPDVLFYGTTTPSGGAVRFYVENESSLRQPPAGGPAWHTRLPCRGISNATGRR